MTDCVSVDAPDVVRVPVWFPSEDRTLAGWIHRTPNATAAFAVVLCNPLGHELVHTHRSVRSLADSLARAGLGVIRFDYSGTGNSSGDQLDDGAVSHWREDTRAAVSFARSAFACASVGIVGLRAGALFAAEAAKADASVTKLVLWHPFASGKRFVREMKATSRMSYFEPDPEYLECAGFPYSIAMQEDLSALDLVESVTTVGARVLFATRDDQPDKKLGEKLAAASNAIEYREVAGYEKMMIEPQFTELPRAAIDELVTWLDTDRDAPSTAALDSTNEPSSFELKQRLETDTYVETPIRLGPSGVFGILCEGRCDKPAGPVVLFGNAGSIYHIGPNRLYVTLARRLAALGYPSVRYDLANIGESLAHKHPQENLAYPNKAIQYMTEVIADSVARGCADKAVLTGFCSGATQAFHAALAQPSSSPLTEIMMVNPKRYYLDPADKTGDNFITRRAHYYNRAIRDSGRWRRLVTGQIDYRQIMGFAWRRFRQQTRRRVARVLSMVGLTEKAPLAQDLRRLVKSPLDLSFFFSSRDPGLHVLLESTEGLARKFIDAGSIPVRTIEDGDHTLIAKRCRDDFVEQFTGYVRERYGSD